MKWIRCKKCNNLKQEVEYYKSGDYFRNVCKSCMKKERLDKKEEKREYDKKRVIQKNKEKEQREICYRCKKYYVNVINNQMKWCFYCLDHYEKQYKTDIKVQVIDKTIRRVKSV